MAVRVDLEMVRKVERFFQDAATFGLTPRQASDHWRALQKTGGNNAVR